MNYTDRRTICLEILKHMKESEEMMDNHPKLAQIDMRSYHKGVYTGLALAMDLVQVYEESVNPEKK